MTQSSSRSTRFRTGSSLVEYALILSVITAGCVVAIEGVGNFTRSPLERLTGSYTETQATAKGPALLSSHPALESELAPWPNFYTNLSLLGCALLACAVLAYHRRFRKLQQQTPEETESEEVRLALIEVLAEKRQSILRILSSRTQAMFANRLEVRHVMTTDVVTVSPRTPVEELRTLMARRRVRHLLVVDPRDESFLGLISDRDLLRRSGNTAKEVMTASPISLPSHSLLAPALTLMLNNRFSCLPLVDDGKLQGVFTLTDAALTLQSVFQVLEHVGFLRPGEDGGHTPFEMECTLHLLQRIAEEAHDCAATIRQGRMVLGEPHLSPAAKPA